MKRKYRALIESRNIRPVEGKEGREWEVIIVAAGESANSNVYPLDVLHRDYEVFNKAPVYISLDKDHDPKYRGVSSTAGFIKGTEPVTEGIGGKLRISDPNLAAKLLDWYENEVLDEIAGLSIVAQVEAKREKKKTIVERLLKGVSVDIVRSPAAGGRFVSVLEAITEREESMCEQCKQLTAHCTCEGSTATQETELSPAMQAAMAEALKAALSADTLKEAMAEAVEEALFKDLVAEMGCPCGEKGCEGCDMGKKKTKEMGGTSKMRQKMSSEAEGDPTQSSQDGETEGEGEGDDPPKTTKESTESEGDPVTTQQFSPEMMKMMQDPFLQSLLSEARLPEHSADRIRKMFDTSVQLDQTKVREAIKDEKDYLAKSEKTVVENLTESQQLGGGRVTADDMDKKIARIDAMFDKRYQTVIEKKDKSGKITLPSYLTFSEAYCDWTGVHPHKINGNDIWRAFQLSTGRFDSSAVEIREGLIYNLSEAANTHTLFSQPYGTTADRDATTVQWGSIIADRMYRSMVRNYYSLDYFEKWQQLVKFVPAKDFREIKRIKIGWYSDLPEVGQGAQYEDLVHPEDQQTSFSVRKYGAHAEGISREMIIDDDIGAVNEIPMKLARAAAHTIYAHIFKTVLEGGETAYRYYNPDGTPTALFAAEHNNILNGYALNGAALDEAEIRMRQQTIYNDPSPTRFDDAGRGTSGNPRDVDDYVLGDSNMPKFLLVNTRNKGTASRLTKPSSAVRLDISAMQGPMNGNGDTPAPGKDITVADDPDRFDYLMPVVIDDFKPSTQAILLADPYMTETLVFSYLNGQQHPDIIVQSDPQVGDNFERDTQTFKIRHEWGVGITDHRGILLVKS